MIGPSEDGGCRSNPAAKGYPPGTKLLCTVEVIPCDPIPPTKSHKGGTKTAGKTTLVCKPFTGCNDTGYTTGYPEHTTKDFGYTTGHPGYTTTNEYTTEDSHTTQGSYTTGKPEYTTDGGYTTEGYTTKEPHFTTAEPEYTTRAPVYTTEHPTTHPTERPVHTTEHYTPKPTLPPPTTPHEEGTTPCVNRPGVKGSSRNCGVKGVKGVKGGYHQPSWSSWQSWNPWGEWESKRQAARKQQTSWLPSTQARRHESVRRPVWNGAWPSSFSAQGE